MSDRGRFERCGDLYVVQDDGLDYRVCSEAAQTERNPGVFDGSDHQQAKERRLYFKAEMMKYYRFLSKTVSIYAATSGNCSSRSAGVTIWWS